MPDVLETKMNEVADGIQFVQEKVESLEKQYDGLDLEAMEETAQNAAKGLEEIQNLRTEIKADELMERLLGVERAIAANGKNGGKQEYEEYAKAMSSYLRTGKNMPTEAKDAFCMDIAKNVLKHGSEEHVKMFAKTMQEGSNPDGGFFVTPDRSEQIIRRIFETSPLRQVANVVTTSSNAVEMIIDDDEPDCGWVGEVEDRDDTGTPEIGLKTIPVHEVYAQPPVTNRMLDDAGFDLEGWLSGKVSRKIGRTENTSFVTGNGSKKPKGFLQYGAWSVAGTYERDALEQITSTGTAGAMDEADDLISLQNALIEDYQMDAVFGMQRSTFGDVMKLKDDYGQYLVNPFMIKEGTDKILLGKPVLFMADMPTVAASALSIVYGDFGVGYTIVDRFGIRVLRDPYTKKGFTRFYTTKRVGGDVTNFEAIKILKIKA